MRMLLGLSEALPSLVEAKFRSAKASSALIFSPTEAAVIRTSAGIPFQLRYCPSLAKKPTPQREDGAAHQKKKKFDPFDNPPADLHIADVPTANPSHLLVLNKFPIIAGHFILATKVNKPQTHSLEQDDLEATFACLKAWQQQQQEKSNGAGRRLFAFFNSGEYSGASQPHRHLQFLSVDCMHDGERTSGWQLLLDLILSPGSEAYGEDTASTSIYHPLLPFSHFARRFSSEPSGPELVDTYTQLYNEARQAVDRFRTGNPGSLPLHSVGGGDLPISYNLAMTSAGMAILPRRAEGSTLYDDTGREVGFVALNGTGLGGTLMVKQQEEWDTLCAHPEKLDSILSAIGIPQDTSPKPRV